MDRVLTLYFYTSQYQIHQTVRNHVYVHNGLVYYSLGGEDTGPRLNIKTVLSTYGDFHVKDKTAVRTSYLYHGNCHTW